MTTIISPPSAHAGGWASEPAATPAAAAAPSSTLDPHDRASVERYLRVPPAPGHFRAHDLALLPAPARRYLRAAIADGAPIPRAVVLHIDGSIRLNGRWLPFTSREVLAPGRGLLWSARVAHLVTGADLAADGQGVVDWKVGGLVPVAHAEGPDVARSGAGRAMGEAVWLPTSLLPQEGVGWTADDDHHVTAHLALDGVETDLDLRLDDTGLVESVRFDRWGDAEGSGVSGWFPFGVEVFESRRFGDLTIPAVGSAGWFPGTSRWAESEFFRFEITAVEPVTRAGADGTGRARRSMRRAVTRTGNRAVAALLRSRGHRILSGSLALVRYRGRRTGREVCLPVQYVRHGDHVLIVPGHPATKTWWRNFEGEPRPVDVLIQGRWSAMTAEVVCGGDQRPEITPLLTAYATRFPAAARQWRRDAARPAVVVDCRPLTVG